jgi:hypothetical protein
VPAISGRAVSYLDGIALTGSEPLLASQSLPGESAQSA